MRLRSAIHRTASTATTLLTAIACLATAAIPRWASADPLVHIVNEHSNADRGLIKLARHRGSTAQASAYEVVITTHYDEICTIPCDERIDVSERPIFFLVRDNRPVSYNFRIPEGEEFTLSVKPTRPMLYYSGVAAAGLVLLFVGVPLMMMGYPRVSIADGPPSDDQQFKKLRRART